MKKCNICHTTVRADNECPICHSSLTFEPDCQETKEHYVWNRYYLIFIIKNVWFSVLCCIFGIVKIILSKPDTSELLMTAIALTILSLTVSVFQRSLTSKMTRKYTDSYAAFITGIWKHLFGGIAVLLFCFI